MSKESGNHLKREEITRKNQQEEGDLGSCLISWKTAGTAIKNDEEEQENTGEKCRNHKGTSSVQLQAASRVHEAEHQEKDLNLERRMWRGGSTSF